MVKWPNCQSKARGARQEKGKSSNQSQKQVTGRLMFRLNAQQRESGWCCIHAGELIMGLETGVQVFVGVSSALG